MVQRTKHQIYNVLVILHLFAEKTLDGLSQAPGNVPLPL